MDGLLKSTNVKLHRNSRGEACPLRTETTYAASTPRRVSAGADGGRFRKEAQGPTGGRSPTPQARPGARRAASGGFRTTARPGREEPVSCPSPLRAPPPHLVLADVVGGDEDADADGDEDEADDEEGRQHRARRQDGLPGRQPLLLERRIIGLAGLHRSPAAATPHRPAARHPDAARGVPVRLLLRAVVHRHDGTARCHRRRRRHPQPRVTAPARHVTRGPPRLRAGRRRQKRGGGRARARPTSAVKARG